MEDTYGWVPYHIWPRWPHVIQHPSIGIFPYCMSKQGITNSISQGINSSFTTYRYVLAMQSPVFQTMLTGGKWKEAKDCEIQLEEASASCEEHFGEFLQFLYTGRIEINNDNVFPLHQLSDKYDVASLNRHCINFIKSVLEKPQCNVFDSIAKYFSLVSDYAPSLLPLCIEAIQFNLWTLEDTCTYKLDLSFLALAHWKQILGEPNGSKVIVSNELNLYFIVHRWILQTCESVESESTSKALQELLPLIRFYNMNASQIETVKRTELGKVYSNNLMKEHLNHAYKLQAELFAFSVTTPKKRKLSGGRIEHKCLDSSAGSGVCEHVNPRCYIGKPYGKEVKTRHADTISAVKSVNTVDLSSLQDYLKVLVGGGDKSRRWSFKWVTKSIFAGQVRETFLIDPSVFDMGRRFTVVICANLMDFANKPLKYTIVKQHVLNANIALGMRMFSPLRQSNEVEAPQHEAKINMVVYLHEKNKPIAQ